MSALSDFNNNLIEEFRANGGEVTGVFAGRPLLLLTTTGARTGNQRTTPLVYTRDGDRYVIVASVGGAPKNPAWYHNLVAHPKVTVEVGADRFDAIAEVAEGDERDRLYAQQAAMMPQFDTYQQNTTRRIPVITLTPT